MEIQGIIIQVMPLQSGVSQRTGNAWQSQEYVIQTEGQYPKKCIFRVFGEERIKQFNIQQGERLTVMIDIDAREYNGKFYNDISCYNVSRGQATQQPQQAAPFPPQQPAGQPQVQQPQQPVQGNQGNLPF